MHHCRIIIRWAAFSVVTLLLVQIQAEERVFERTPPVREAQANEPMVALLGSEILEPAEFSVMQVGWLQANDAAADFAFGNPECPVQLSDWNEQLFPPVYVAEEPDQDPIAEPIVLGPMTMEPGYCWEACPGCRPQPCWTFQADASMLWRTRSRDIKIVEEGTGTPPRGQRDALLTTDALHQDPTWGPRLTIGRRWHDCHRLEVTYFGLNQWTSRAAFDGINGVGFSFLNIDVPFDTNITSDFDGAQFVSATYTSEIHNFEMNVMTDDRWDLNRSAGYPWYQYVDFLAGIRYFRLSEEFDLASTDAGQTSNYLIDATNDMVGGQLGLIAGTYCSPTISWNVVGKVGLFANLGKQSTLLRDDNNTVLLRDFTTHDEELAFLGELNFKLAYDIRPNVSLTAGYTLMWIDGVALAPEQLDFTTTVTSGSGLNQNGNILFHGALFGLEITH